MATDDRVNILLVDDQLAKLLSYEVILSELGENLIRASSAGEAFEQLLRKEIAVILIDVCMPELDGFELATMIRNHPRFESTAMIFVSAIALTDLDRLRGYECGAVDYVPVPVDPELLRAKVRVFAELYRKTKQLAVLNAELERRVEERTAELAQANAELEKRVEERTRAVEAALAQVHEMRKLESLGQLTGGVAHDFNNLLMTILGNLDLLRKKLPNDPLLRRLVDGAIQGAERGATLTARMLAFARRQDLKPETVDVVHLITGMAELLQRSVGPAIQLGMEFPDSRAMICVDRNQLEMALLNLAVNARDAMPETGRVTIAARRERVSDDAKGFKPGSYVCLSVTDTGSGMDEATLKRAAEPFFTTKGIGQGTGLGLSMVYGLATQSGGDMRISSAVGTGTTVELWFPLVERAEGERSESVAATVGPPAMSCCLLLVDDDAHVAASTTAMLEDLGHTVLAASSGALALDVIRSQGVKIDLVITDHAMPGMTGMELAKHIRQIRPDLPVILATGYADLRNGDDLALPRLAKPYRQAEVADMIETLVRQARAGNVVALSTVKRA
jgi:signal transduction histidine kinase/ActR/RegA family two-component response regulator